MGTESVWLAFAAMLVLVNLSTMVFITLSSLVSTFSSIYVCFNRYGLFY